MHLSYCFRLTSVQLVCVYNVEEPRPLREAAKLSIGVFSILPTMSQHTKSQMVVSLVPYASPNSPNNPALTRAHSGSTGSLPATESTSPAQTDCLPSPETSRRLITKIGRQPANPGNGIRRSMFVEDLISNTISEHKLYPACQLLISTSLRG